NAGTVRWSQERRCNTGRLWLCSYRHSWRRDHMGQPSSQDRTSTGARLTTKKPPKWSVLTDFDGLPRLEVAKMLPNLLDTGGAAPMATSTEESSDIGILERIGDGFGAFSESCVNFLTRLFGSSNERTVKDIGLIRTKDLANPYRIIP